MGDKTGIEWTDATWNPIVGCSIVSPGCTNCYAMKWANQKLDGSVAHYLATTKVVNGNAVWSGHVALAPDHIITAPLQWKKPRRIFVNSMGDLFHESVPDEWIDRVFAVMALAPQHTFQVLTKRSKRMREYMTRLDQEPQLDTAKRIAAAWPGKEAIPKGDMQIVPLPNVWLGVSAEDQARYDERHDDLYNTPAAVRFISYEPAVDRLDLCESLGMWWNQTMRCWEATGEHINRDKWGNKKLDWLICGGESGKGARPMHPAWVRSIREQCAAAGVPFFFKQWGEWRADALLFTDMKGRCPPPNYREGKRRTGNLLDGRTHLEFPELKP